ncbi:MAG: hypothetical protein NVS4B2_17550 [Chloroflexota bacterium]
MTESETLRLQTTDRLYHPFLVGGDRAHVIGAQDGGFADRGWHVPGEMGGAWAPPTKLLDGFWLEIDGTWLRAADAFTVHPFSAAHHYCVDDDLRVIRRQYVPDGHAAIVVRYSFYSASRRALALRFLARTDLQGVWSPSAGSGTGHPDSTRYVPRLRAWSCVDSVGGRRCLVGALMHAPLAHSAGHDVWGPERTAGAGISVILEYDVTIPEGGETSMDFVICGAEAGEARAEETFRQVSTEVDGLYRHKERRFHDLLTRSALQIPDASIQCAWDWLKCNYDWLVRDVDGMGRGLGAGADEFMWWFGCDTSFAVLGCLALGQHDIAIQSLDLLRELSLHENGDSGRVIHECTTAGEVTDAGRLHETPHYALAVLETFRWTGDLAFLERSYPFCKSGVLGWVLAHCRDGDNLLPYGYGMTELWGLDMQCVDSAAYTAAALEALAEMAEVVGDCATVDRCRCLAPAARSQVESSFWLEEEGLYADMLATSTEMIPRIRRWLSTVDFEGSEPIADFLSHLRALLAQAESDPEPERKRAWLLKNWTIISPLDAGVAGAMRAGRTLDRVEGYDFTSPYGMYLNGYERTTTMSINTGVLALAEIRHGRIDKGLDYVRCLTDSIHQHMPGAISEILPDAGCFVQAWSGYAVAWPVVSGLFGVRPDAARRRLEINARFPDGWHGASLCRVRVGSNDFDVEWDGERIHVRGGDDDWTVTSSTATISRVRHPVAP